MKELFVLIIMIWGFFGLMGIVHNASYERCGANWFMIIFYITVPFIPWIAKSCGLI